MENEAKHTGQGIHHTCEPPKPIMSSVDTSESKKASLTTLVKTFSVAVASCPANTCFVAFDCLFVCAIDLPCYV